jgi:signal transduction histidine kinase
VPGGFLAFAYATILGLLLAGLIFAVFASRTESRPGPIFAFGLLTAFLAATIPFSIIFNDARDVDTYSFAFSAHSLLARGAFIAWIFYLHALTDFTLNWWPRLMYGFEFVRTLAIAAHLDTPYFLSIRGIERVPAIFGDVITHAVAEPTPLHALMVIGPVLHWGYTIAAIVTLSRMGRRRLALYLGVPFLVVLALVFVDNLADSLRLSTMYFTELAFPLVIFALAASLMEWVLAGQRARVTVVEQEAQIARVLDSITDAVVACDRSWRILRMNPIARSLASNDLVIGSHFWESFHLVDPETHEPPTITSIAETPRDLVADFGGESRLFHVTARAIDGPSREPLGHVVVMHDITDRARRERLNRRNEKMRALGELAGGVAHDFNNYLTAIGASARMLERRGDDRSAREAISARIGEAVTQATALTRRLLDYSRESEEFEPFMNETVSINEVVERTADLIRSLVGRRIEVITLLGAEQDRVRGSVQELQVALLNLAKNSADAIDGEGFIRIATADMESADHGPGVAISFEDSGTGIAAGDLERIFEPFFTTKPIGEGTGFGLPSVHRIVTSHSGTIEVESEPGVGTTFTLTFPRLSTPARRTRTSTIGGSAATARPPQDTARPT